MLTYLFYLVIISVEETFAYSGYTVMPTSFFLAGIARRTDMHLLTYAEGNFGPWGIMDWICKTNVGDSGDTVDDAQADAEDREREQKARAAWEAAKKKAAAVSSSSKSKQHSGRRR
jgi:hypothetical protein